MSNVFQPSDFVKLTAKDREYHNFELDDEGKIARRTNLKGEIRPAGLTKNFKVTTMVVGDTAQPIPLIPLEDRNAISIHNKGLETIFIGASNVTPDEVEGITSGWELDAGSYLNFDITDQIILYGICQAGKSVKLKILELA